MRAIAQDRYGSASVLRLRDVARPSIKDGQVLVQVRAAALDPGVWIAMTGRPYAARAAFGLSRPRVAVRGRAFAGVVEEAGTTDFKPGDEVYGTTSAGSLAEFTVAVPKRMALKPPRLTFEQAAAVPISAVTALESVRGRVHAGQRVMIVGAAGGIGTYAVQLAKARGATVTAVCGPGKADLVRSLGADDVIDYTRAEVDRDGPAYDVIIDLAGSRPLSLLRRALTSRGVLLLTGGGHDAGGLLGGYTRQLRAPFVSMITTQRLRGVTAGERAADLDELTRLIEDGTLTPVIDRVYPLAETADAMSYLAAGHPAGKIVVTV